MSRRTIDPRACDTGRCLTPSRPAASWLLVTALAVTACSAEPQPGDASLARDAEASVVKDASDASTSEDGAEARDVRETPDVPFDGPPLTGTLRDVQHVVIFVQENRSFDNYFGALSGVRGFGDPAIQMLHTGASVFHQPDGMGEVLPFHTGLDCVNDVDHGWATGHDAWHGGLWDRWVPAKGPAALSSHNRAELPFYYALADAYTVLDAYFCSTMSSTNPNRLYLMTGTLDAAGTGGGPVIDNTEPSAGFTWTTYPERLQSAGVSWRVYQALDNYDDNALAWFRAYKTSAPGEPLYERGLLRVLDLVSEFRHDVEEGTLPQVSWIVAPTALSEHPPYPLSSGQNLTQRLLEALASNPAVARSTVFFLTYDENGGFFDHVAPPTPPAGTADEFVRGAPIGFGNRVPMIVVSPWSRGGVVDSEVSDHTSILRFLERWTGVREPNISAWRRQVAGDLTSAFDFAHPDFTSPVLTPITAASCRGAAPRVPATQAVPTQDPGPRPARGLPYQPSVASRTDCAAGRFYIAMTNAGTAAVHYQIAANQFRSDGTWQYDVAPGATVEDYFSVQTYGGGRYDLTLSGPNGFERQFVGDINTACGALEVTSLPHPTASTLELTYINRGTSEVTFTTTATRYRTDGPWTNTVAAGATASRTIDLTEMGQRWYALTVTASGDALFRRRFAGHIENGRPGITGL